MDSQKKKELIAGYKERKISGGVYMITNTKTGMRLLAAETNLEGSKNKFDFCIKTNLCSYPKLQEEWKRYGAQAFTFEVLEELKKDETQTDREFAQDIGALFELWQERLREDGADETCGGPPVSE